jgi:hypothetical protein
MIGLYFLYCDLDHVLVDFVPNAERFKPGFINLPKKERRHFLLAEANRVFWATNDWTKDGKDLWDYINKFNPTILSAVARDCYPIQDEIVLGKLQWIKRNLGIKYMAEAILVHRRDKNRFGGPDGILIDDYEKNILEWRNTGGIGIHHKNAKDTIEELKKYANLR